MSLFSFLRPKASAPVARERLQLLLAYERQNRGQPDLVNVLREEILALITRHVQVNQDDVMIKMERGATSSKLEIDIQIPNAARI
jgi:cell division topological specificity factor